MTEAAELKERTQGEAEDTRQRFLLLEDGTVFEGRALGGDTFEVGELVFNTNMAGYQEILFESSFCGQIVVMTYPMIGNYGINRDGFESMGSAIHGLVVSEHCEAPSNFSSQLTVDEFLKLRHIPAIEGVDTRKLTRHIREHGSMKACFTDSLDDLEGQLRKLKESEIPKRLVEKISISKPFHIPGSGKRVVLMDFGSINEILKELILRQMDIYVLPYNTSFEEIEFFHVDGVILSNGPGDPNELTEAIETVRGMIGRYPILGIGLGHQLLALAAGAEVHKMKLGHWGANYPIKNLSTGRIDTRIANNSYAVDRESLEGSGLEVAYEGADGSCEGLIDEARRLFSIQFHLAPLIGDEANTEIFERFAAMIESRSAGADEAEAATAAETDGAHDAQGAQDARDKEEERA